MCDRNIQTRPDGRQRKLDSPKSQYPAYSVSARQRLFILAMAAVSTGPGTQ